jgi:hypothetical protein
MWYTSAEIGRLLGRTQKAVQRYCWRNGIKLPWHLHHKPQTQKYPTRKWTAAEWNRALRLSETRSIAEVGALLRRSRFSVWSKFKSEGVRFGQGTYSASDAAAICGCSPAHACRTALRLGLNSRGKGFGRRYKLDGAQVRRLVKEIRPGRLYRCEGL